MSVRKEKKKKEAPVTVRHAANFLRNAAAFVASQHPRAGEPSAKLHGQTTRVCPIWRAASELTVAFGPSVSFINASYDTTGRLFPAMQERTRKPLRRGDRQRASRAARQLPFPPDEDIQARPSERKIVSRA